MKYRRSAQKKNIPGWKIAVLAAVLLALLVALFLLTRLALSDERPSCAGGEAPDAAEPTPEPTLLDLYAYFDWTETTTIKVYDHRADKLVDMDLEEYIVGVVSAEMPVRYEFEALKAQAVASRTYTLYSMAHGGCHTNPDADVCTNSKCCQAFSTHERMRETWGKDYTDNYARIAEAVMGTAGEVLVYDGKLCDALYHACSGGQTEDSEHVYANAIPYLRGVDSPYEDPMRTEDVDFGYDALAELIAAKYPESGVTADNVKAAISIESAYPSGRVETLRLGKTTVTGKQARNLFGLRSTMFTIERTQNGIVFHVKGYGHGVGMSQNGANGMAKHGSDYRAILLHYYTGVTLGSYDENGVGPYSGRSATPPPEETGIVLVPED